MGHKLNWNISLEKGTEIAHSALISILNEQKNKKMPLNELIHLMNERTKHHKVHISKKYNFMSKFIKANFKGNLETIKWLNSSISVASFNSNLFLYFYKFFEFILNFESCRLN